jgi:tyrosine-protein phosphatase non-receptor type 13
LFEFLLTQIIAVDGVSLLNLSYTEALKLLQNTGRIVELVLSQIYKPNKLLSQDKQATHNNSSAQIFTKPSPTKAKSIQNIFNQSLNEINIEFDQIEQAIKNTNLYDGQYYRNGDDGYHYQAEIVNFMKQLKEQEHNVKLAIPASQMAKELSKSNRDLVVPRRAQCENFKLTPSKSMPDLPKVS